MHNPSIKRDTLKRAPYVLRYAAIGESMRAWKYLPLVLATVVSGCASMSDLSAKLEAKASCCRSPADFKYEPLPPGAPTPMSLSDESPVYVFAAGKSYFKAHVLPQQRTATKLRVRSFATGSTAFETRKLSQLYCPQVSFLSSSYETLTSTDVVPSVARGQLATGILPSFVADFEVPTSAVYVVLHTNPAGYGRLATRYTGSGAYMVGSALVIERGGEPIHHPSGPIANAEISLL